MDPNDSSNQNQHSEQNDNDEEYDDQSDHNSFREKDYVVENNKAPEENKKTDNEEHKYATKQEGSSAHGNYQHDGQVPTGIRNAWVVPGKNTTIKKKLWEMDQVQGISKLEKKHGGGITRNEN